jgi:serralysin
LPSNVDTLYLTGTATQGVGNGDAAGDTLYSDAGIDTLVGHSLHDTFVINNTADTVVGQPGSNDVVYATVNFTLPSNVDTLFLTGTATLGIGNSDAAGDTLYSDAGIDTLVGHSLHDSFVIGNTADTVIGQPGSNDVVYAIVDYVLPSNVDTLVLGGSATHGTANNHAAGDTLYANAGAASTLVGGTANDTLYVTGTAGATLSGGAGSDSFVFPAHFGNDAITDFQAVGAGADVIEFSSADFTSFDAAGDSHSVMANAVQSANDVVISNPTNGADSVTLIGHVLGDLVSTDFHLV